MIASAEIKVGGSPLDEELAKCVMEVRVEDNLMLPDSFLIRIADPQLEHIDSHPLQVGTDVEIAFAAPDDHAATKVLEGQVTSLEPEFGAEVMIAVRGYDHSHGLNRTKRSDTFQQMTAGDIARKVASGAGFQAGTIDDEGGVLDFVQQNNETDWDFLWRLASRLDFEVVVTDKTKLHFRKAGDQDADTVELKWGEKLKVFRPRVTGIQQVDEVVVRGWNPKSNEVIESTARVEQTSSEIGIQRSDVSGALNGGTVTIADRPILSNDEADALAKSVISQLGNAYLEAEGTAVGSPKLRAGTKVDISGIGTKFSGKYKLSSTTHLFRSRSGYNTLFSISGRRPRHLVDLMTPATPRSWGNCVVVGHVTNNNDPDKLGRVRVKFPALGEGVEGWWARVVGPAAGKDRGLLMTPQVGDEVVIAFEHDDVRFPYVLGSVWNGKGSPGDLSQHDGSFVLQSDKFMNLKSKDSILIRSDKDFSLEVASNMTEKAQKDITIESDGESITNNASKNFVVQAGQDVQVQAGSKVQIVCGSDLEITAGGSLSIVAGKTVTITAAQGINLI